MNATSPEPHDHHAVPQPADAFVTGHDEPATTGHPGHGEPGVHDHEGPRS